LLAATRCLRRKTPYLEFWGGCSTQPSRRAPRESREPNRRERPPGDPLTPSRLRARLRVPNRTAPTLEPRRSSGRSLRLPISPPVERRIRGPRCLTHGTGTMTVGVGRRKLSPVLLVLCIAGLLRSATAALNTPTCPAVLDAYTGGASSVPLNRRAAAHVLNNRGHSSEAGPDLRLCH
jgi:hypothetical protein